MIQGPIPSQGLLPHGAGMHLIDEVLRYGETRVEGEIVARIRAEGPYFGPDGFEEHWLIELCAQASAALYRLSLGDVSGHAAKGFLVSVREFSFFPAEEIFPGDELRILIDMDNEAAPLGHSTCQVLKAKRLIAEGQLTFLLEGDG